jgi:hypothetical protein
MATSRATGSSSTHSLFGVALLWKETLPFRRFDILLDCTWLRVHQMCLVFLGKYLGTYAANQVMVIEALPELGRPLQLVCLLH